MKKKLLILLGFFMAVQFSYSLSCFFPGYRIEESIIKYSSIKNEKIMEKVEKDSFKILDRHFAVDEKYVYYNGIILEGIDVNTFEIVSEFEPKPIKGSPWGIGCQYSYIEKFKDKNGVYDVKDIKTEKLEFNEENK